MFINIVHKVLSIFFRLLAGENKHTRCLWDEVAKLGMLLRNVRCAEIKPKRLFPFRKSHGPHDAIRAPTMYLPAMLFHGQRAYLVEKLD